MTRPGQPVESGRGYGKEVEMRKMQIAKADRVNHTFRANYTKQQYKDGCAAAYATGLMDGEEGCVVKPDVSGLHGRVRIQNTTRIRSQGGRVGEASLSPHYIQVLRQYDNVWVTVKRCPNQDTALAFREDLLTILARSEAREE